MVFGLRRELALERARREGFEAGLTGEPLPIGGTLADTAEEREAFRDALERGRGAARRFLPPELRGD